MNISSESTPVRTYLYLITGRSNYELTMGFTKKMKTVIKISKECNLIIKKMKTNYGIITTSRVC